MRTGLHTQSDTPQALWASQWDGGHYNPHCHHAPICRSLHHPKSTPTLHLWGPESEHHDCRGTLGWHADLPGLSPGGKAKNFVKKWFLFIDLNSTPKTPWYARRRKYLSLARMRENRLWITDTDISLSWGQHSKSLYTIRHCPSPVLAAAEWCYPRVPDVHTLPAPTCRDLR